MDDEEETYRLWKIRKTIMQVGGRLVRGPEVGASFPQPRGAEGRPKAGSPGLRRGPGSAGTETSSEWSPSRQGGAGRGLGAARDARRPSASGPHARAGQETADTRPSAGLRAWRA